MVHKTRRIDHCNPLTMVDIENIAFVEAAISHNAVELRIDSHPSLLPLDHQCWWMRSSWGGKHHI